MNRQLEKEEEYLEDLYANGELTNEEFNKELRELRRAHQAYAEEAAQEAYDNELWRW